VKNLKGSGTRETTDIRLHLA